MLAAHMQLAEGILGHARRLQDHGIELDILPARKAREIGGGDGIGGSAELGLDASRAAPRRSAVTVTLSIPSWAKTGWIKDKRAVPAALARRIERCMTWTPVSAAPPPVDGYGKRPDLLKCREARDKTRDRHMLKIRKSGAGRGSSAPAMGHRIVMRQDGLGDFDGRNHRQGKEENQRAGRDILAAIKQLAERAIVGIFRRGRVFPVRRRGAGIQLGADRLGRIVQKMNMRLGGIALQQECQQHKAGEQKPARPPQDSFTGQSSPHLSFTLERPAGKLSQAAQQVTHMPETAGPHTYS